MKANQFRIFVLCVALGCAPFVVACGDDDGGGDRDVTGQDSAGEDTMREDTSSDLLCDNTCASASDGECDDGGEDSLFSVCELGTDCDDCGPREPSDECQNEADCDAGFYCDGETCVPDTSCEPSCGSSECGSDGCGGSCGTCNSDETCNAGVCETAGDGCPFDAYCDGDSRVFCTGIVQERQVCPEGCTNGECATPPSSITVNVSYGSASSTTAGETTLLSFSGPPTFDPSTDNYPVARAEDLTAMVPAPPSGCTIGGQGFTTNRSEATAQMTGRGCSSYFDEISRSGVTFEFEDTQRFSGGTIDATYNFRP